MAVTVFTQSICPKCKADLNYGEGEINNDSYSYEVNCSKCNFKGLEHYNLTFSEIEETN